MEPKEPQLSKEENKVVNLADERIARRTPFGPMSKFQAQPENRIVHKSIKEDK